MKRSAYCLIFMNMLKKGKTINFNFKKFYFFFLRFFEFLNQIKIIVRINSFYLNLFQFCTFYFICILKKLNPELKITSNLVESQKIKKCSFTRKRPDSPLKLHKHGMFFKWKKCIASIENYA